MTTTGHAIESTVLPLRIDQEKEIEMTNPTQPETTTDDDEIIPTTEEAFSWRDQLAIADEMGQRLLGELHAARVAAQELLRKEVLHSGSGRDGHLNEDDLAPLFAALRIEMRP